MKGRKSMNGKKILIVEDDHDTQVLLKKRLEYNGFQCESVDSVEAAFKALQSFYPEVVILDLGFKKASGAAFLQNARKWLPTETPLPRVIVLSGHNHPQIIDFVMASGANGFISKPFNPERLMTLVQENLFV